MLTIKVEDNGIGFERQKGIISKGFELYSVQKRIKLLYKDKARFQIFPRIGGGTCVILILPCEL